jgi:hypothetical protein
MQLRRFAVVIGRRADGFNRASPLGDLISLFLFF